jgi:hypothetical protein
MNLEEYWQSKCWRAALAVASSAHAESISGRAHVLDGDTIEVAGLRLRLIGIVAPESRQTCTAAGREWPCGADATKAVRAMIGGRRVECTVHGRYRYSRALAGASPMSPASTPRSYRAAGSWRGQRTCVSPRRAFRQQALQATTPPSQPQPVRVLEVAPSPSVELDTCPHPIHRPDRCLGLLERLRHHVDWGRRARSPVEHGPQRQGVADAP